MFTVIRADWQQLAGISLYKVEKAPGIAWHMLLEISQKYDQALSSTLSSLRVESLKLPLLILEIILGHIF